MGNAVVYDRAEVQRRIHLKLFPQESQKVLMTPVETTLAKLSASSIRVQLADGTLGVSLERLVEIYFGQLQKYGNSNFALTDIFYDKALQRAAQFTATVRDFSTSSEFDKYPLLGFVMSLKDSIKYQNSDSTLGFTKNIGRPYTETPKFIKYLEYQGAIILCKGNVPQALMPLECDNVCFGATSNPFDDTRTSGGSSGGDTVLVATQCVNAALGTDIAGSLRAPALFCGVYAFKPTAGRLPLDAEAGPFDQLDVYGKTGDRQTLIKSTIGPIAKSVEDIITLSRVMVNYNVYDPRVPLIPWKDVPAPKRVGLVKGFEVIMENSMTAERALTEASEALQRNGFEIVNINIRDHVEKIVLYAYAIFFKDQGLMNIIDNKVGFAEALSPSFENIKRLMEYPLSELKQHIKTMNSRERIMMDAYITAHEYNIGYLMDMQMHYSQLLIDSFMSAGVEVAIAPGIFPAIKKFTSQFCNLMTAFLIVWNFANFPAGAVPITRVKAEEENYVTTFEDSITNSLRSNLHGSTGLPVGVQVVGLPWRDELVVAVMRSLEQAIGFK